MFRGTHYNKLDGKGRLVIPSRWRDLFDAQDCGMVVTGHPDRYLLLQFRRDYEELERRLGDFPETSPEALYYKQTLIGMADDSISFDTAGRINLSQSLRDHAELRSEVAVLGMGGHLRLWCREKLDALQAEVRKSGEVGKVPEGWNGFTV